MITDRQGNPLNGATPAAAARFDEALHAFNIYRGDPVRLLDAALEAAPQFPMARLFKAHVFALATEPAATAEARKILAELRGLRLDEREAAHLAALDHLVNGNWSAAANVLTQLSARYPRDLLALQSGHLMDFYRGNQRELRDRLARALPEWSPAIPGYPILRGMYAFGLEECGDYARAEEEGRSALDGEPLDCWAHHAVAHVMEMQGRAEDGIGWMIAREPYWSGDDNFFKVHNWWHRALYHLALQESDEALALYDGPIREARSVVALDLVDASAFLWRFHLLGHDAGHRWRELAEAWDRHADGRTYSFNDWHAVMAWLGAGRDRDVQGMLAMYRAGASGADENALRAREIGLPLIEGFVAFWHADYARAIERLYGVRHIANAFGGSHAQRDVIDWTLTESVLRGGQAELAAALAHERLARKPHSRLDLGFLTRARERREPGASGARRAIADSTKS
ncbi:MAG TPA: tetratricopeptide repeat protein [Steroidobacteraceae bacterium]|jgi:tetratricopeptide (TPR) repeat protein|nr:tetratricopeptide repeat protein [Steroidobacteraceae bacterium]